MKLKNKLSVMVATHLIHASSDTPYYDNEMLITTIKSSHEKLKLDDIVYYIYIDSVCQPNTNYKQVEYDRYLKYKEILTAKIEKEIPYINTVIVENTGRFKANFRHMLDNCNTDYYLFLEHDWEFVQDVNAIDIIQCMDEYTYINYVKFNRLGTSDIQWDIEEGGLFEAVNEINNIPLTKISIYSGNPHIMRTDIMKNVYLKWHAERWSDHSNINPYLEKDLLQIAKDHINEFGKYDQHKSWGCFLYGNVENWKVTINHLGDWCRKK
jgi:hypothetical protein